MKVKLVFGLALATGVVYGVTVFGGFVDVAATSAHLAPIEWTLETARRNAVERESKAVTAPNLDGKETIRRGAAAYAEMCANCHAAPGQEADEALAGGLLPHPPELAKIVSERTSEELFWVTKHGVKMTGMPAWGPSHSDADLWAIVAFIGAMPKMTPESYRQLRSGATGQDVADMPAQATAATGGHAHGHHKTHDHGAGHTH